MIIYEPQTQYIKKEIVPVLISEADQAYNYAYEWFSKNAQDLTREHLILICLNSRGFVVNTKILTVGTERQTLCQPKDIIKHVLIANCSSFIILHNHPAGDPSPSAQDHRVTRALREACQIMDINFQDHVVMGEPQNDPTGLGYYSFRNAGII